MTVPKKNNIIVWGGKSQSKILIEIIKLYKKNKITAIVDPKIDKLEISKLIPFVKTVNEFKKYLKKSNYFIVGIGGGYGLARSKISKKLIDFNLKPLSAIHPTAFLHKTCKIGKGLQVMPGVNVNCFSKIGDFAILNTASTVDHECIIGNGVHIMGNSYVGGRVKIGDFVTIGSNATIFPDIEIKSGAFIGAGSVVRKNVGENQVVVGNPAKFLKSIKQSYDLGFLQNFK